jgi:hypothetical protein
LLHRLDRAWRQLDQVALEVKLWNLLQQLLVAASELWLTAWVEVLEALGPLLNHCDQIVQAVSEPRSVLLQLLHMLELGQLLLLGVVQLLLEDTNVHLALRLKLLDTLPHVDRICQLDLEVLGAAL